MHALEAFDEYEEWHHKCMHYILALGLQGAALRPVFAAVRDTQYDAAAAVATDAPGLDPAWVDPPPAFRRGAPGVYAGVPSATPVLLLPGRY